MSEIVAFSILGVIILFSKVIIYKLVDLYNRITRKDEKAKARMDADVDAACLKIMGIIPSSNDEPISKHDIARQVVILDTVVSATLDRLASERKIVESEKGWRKTEE